MRGIKPKLSDWEFEGAIDKQGGVGGIKGHVSDIGKVINTVSGKIKEHGFYVDCKKSSFVYPSLDRNDMVKMADFLFAMIQALTTTLDLYQIKLQSEMDFVNLANKLIFLEKRLS